MDIWILNGLAISLPLVLVSGAEIFGLKRRWLSLLAATVAAMGLIYLLGRTVIGPILSVGGLLMMPIYMVLFFAYLHGSDTLVSSIIWAAKETLCCGTGTLPIATGILVLLAICWGLIRLS